MASRGDDRNLRGDVPSIKGQGHMWASMDWGLPDRDGAQIMLATGGGCAVREAAAEAGPAWRVMERAGWRA